MPKVSQCASSPIPPRLAAHLDPHGSSPGSVHPDDVQVAEVDALLVEPGAAGATPRPQVGASGMAWGHWLLLGGSGLALACMHRREREVERWVRTPGTAGIGGPARLLLLHNRGSWHSHGSGSPDQPGKPQQPGGKGQWPPCARPVPQHLCTGRAPGRATALGSRPVRPSWLVGHHSPQGRHCWTDPGLLQQARPDGSPSCRATSRARATEHQAVGMATIAAECRAGLEQGAGSRERACCLRPAAKLSQADSSLPPCPGCL